jgi:hypothetical protein
VRAERVCWLRAPGGHSARPGGQSARRSRGQLAEQAIFLSLTHLLVAPLPHVRGCESKRPFSFFVAAPSLPILSQTHNTTSTPLTHSSFLPTDTTSIVRGIKASTPPQQGKLLFVLQGPFPLWIFIHWNLSLVQPRARTRYMQSSIDLSTQCIS